MAGRLPGQKGLTALERQRPRNSIPPYVSASWSNLQLNDKASPSKAVLIL
jgi:hypothetical protein